MQKRWWVIIFVGVALMLGITYALVRLNKAAINDSSPYTNTVETEASAITAGKKLSNNKCSGEGSKKLTNLPMNESDYSSIVPYGLVIGGHVTPIDHQYFSPASYDSPRDAYSVYAMADANITDISERTTERGTEYRFVFTMSCTFFYYYDLVTSLAPEIKVVYDKDGRNVNIPITAGQLVGRIGGQTLDFAVWDTEKPLTGFIVDEHYEGEPWKLYTADPLDYYTSEIKEIALSKYLRSVEPISGKIDYDIDGKLIGNWFLDGTTGYAGATGRTGTHEYWVGHLSIAPEHLDPTAYVFSTGDWGGKAQQFLIKLGSTNPEIIGVETGIVKYELYQIGFALPNGKNWDRKSAVKGIKAVEQSGVQGCVLLELISDRVLKLENFPDKACADVSGFTNGSKLYRR